MKSHQFDLDTHRAPEHNIIRLRAYVRNRYGKGALPAKGRATRQRNMAAVITGRKWTR
jgi:hypothetical protein